MTQPTLRQFADAEQISRAAAAEFVRLAREAIAARGRFTVAMAGGSTPKRMYELLADEPLRDEVEWSKVEFFWGDERAVPPDHKDSNFLTADEALLRKLALLPERVHRMQADRADRDAAAADYQRELARVFGADPNGPPPAFDLVLLGMGPDGHTASLFPGNAALRETNRWAVPVAHAPKPPPDRLTLTYPILNAARQVLFLVGGADKAPVLAEVLEGCDDAERLPSQSVRPTEGKLTWFLDRAATARLKAPPETVR